MNEFSESHGIDTRFAVLPGVLHEEPVWGAGTTEYALDAIKFAVLNFDPAIPQTLKTAESSERPSFPCPIDPKIKLPMVCSKDLVRGLLSLADADQAALQEPQRGYVLPGVSFTANDLFLEIRKHYPNFEWNLAINPNMNKFARLWPDTLDLEEPRRDLGYQPKIELPMIVEYVINGHRARLT